MKGILALPLVPLGCASNGSDTATARTTMCGANLCIDVTDPENKVLATVGGALYVDARVDILVVIRTGPQSVAALSAICTHQGCMVDVAGGSNTLYCPCHGSEFDDSGRVLAGPARQPLRNYAATMTGSVVTITLG